MSTMRSGTRRTRQKARGRPRLELVVPRPRRVARLPFVVASAAVVGILVFGIVSLQTLTSQSSFRVRELTRRNAQLQEAYGRLQLQVAELSAPGRIARAAKDLGFELPDPDRVHTIAVDGVQPRAGHSPSPQDERDPSFALKRELGNGP
jgi:cell division protein FtsL